MTIFEKMNGLFAAKDDTELKEAIDTLTKNQKESVITSFVKLWKERKMLGKPADREFILEKIEKSKRVTFMTKAMEILTAETDEELRAAVSKLTDNQKEIVIKGFIKMNCWINILKRSSQRWSLFIFVEKVVLNFVKTTFSLLKTTNAIYDARNSRI